MDWLRGGRPSIADSLKVIVPLASALAYLHARQLAHRDLKSTNVLLDSRRHIYLTDFGLARVLTVNTQAVHTGHGTPPYAPPEQHLGGRLTARSDLYSLGILCYELLTGQLPWAGERSLGLQQVRDSREVLPDPRQLNGDVPRELAAVLWSLTAADPAGRPPSAAAALDLMRQALPPALWPHEADDGIADAVGEGIADAAELHRRSCATWTEGPLAVYPLNLTRFVMIDTAYQADSSALPAEGASAALMLSGAMLYQWRLAEWWAQVADPEQRIAAVARLVAEQPPAALESLATVWSTGDAALRAWATRQPLTVWAPLLEATRAARRPEPLARALALLEQASASPASWRPVCFSEELDTWLGELACSPAGPADQALRLVAHVRSERAAAVLLGEADEDGRREHLMRLLALVGSLPAVVPARLQWQLRISRLGRQLTADSGALLHAGGLSALGAALGFGGYVWWSYRLPTFMDATRWLVALERGIFLGIFAGMAVLMIRAMIQRLTGLARGLRLAVGVGAGSLALLVAFLGYDVLFLDLSPTGWLVPAGCLAMAAGYGLAAGVKPYGLRLALSAAGVTLALTLTWAGHLLTAMTPLLYFETTWSWPAVVAVALWVALPAAALGNWGTLAIEPG